MINQMSWGELKTLVEAVPEVSDDTPVFFIMVEADSVEDLSVNVEPTGLVVT